MLLRRRMGWGSLADLLYVSANHYRAPTASALPPALLRRLNTSSPVAQDHKFCALAERQYEEQVNAFGGRERLSGEVQQLRGVLKGLRARCDPGGSRSELRGRRAFLPPCSHDCEGHARVARCFQKYYKEELPGARQIVAGAGVEE